MKKILGAIKKYKIYILSFLLIIFFLRSCSKTGQVKKLEKNKVNNLETIDSLNLVITQKNDSLNMVSELIKIEKLRIHMEYDNWITQKNRGVQLMELHFIVKDNIKKLEK